jgi:hypothetical protein
MWTISICEYFIHVLEFNHAWFTWMLKNAQQNGSSATYKLIWKCIMITSDYIQYKKEIMSQMIPDDPSWFQLIPADYTLFQAHLHHQLIMAACIVVPASLYNIVLKHNNQCNLKTTKHSTERKHNNQQAHIENKVQRSKYIKNSFPFQILNII